MGNRSPEVSREQQLEEIRRTYADYERSGRHRLWDTANRGFARISRDRNRAITELLRRSVGRARVPAVLDLGCGTGDTAESPSTAGISVEWTGVDLLPELLARARGEYPWGTFVEASADALPFESGSFDVVIAATLFSSLPSSGFEEAVAAEIGRVLRHRGWLVWYDLRMGNPNNPAVHGVPISRIHRLFPGWPAELRTMTVMPPVARRLGPLTPLVYPALEAIPVFRSHVIGRLERPDTSGAGRRRS